MRAWHRRRIPLFAYLAVMGPGLITALANNDAGGITTYSVAGARYRYSMLFVLAIITILLAVTQEMGARMGAVTGKGLADLIREEFGLRATVFALLILLVANLAVTAAEFAGIASAMELFGVSRYISAPIAALVIWGLVSSGSFRRVEKIFLAFIFFYLSYVGSGILAHPPWEEVLHKTVVPSLELTSDFVLITIAIIGTTVAPWGQFFIQSYVRDKGVTITQYGFARLDVLTGAIATNAIAFFIIVSTGTVLAGHGNQIETAADAAKALAPLVGAAATQLFGVGLLAASTLSAAILPLTCAYVVCEAFGWESGVGKRWEEAPVFNAIFTTTILAGTLIVLLPGVDLISLMLLAQTANGLLLPVILIYVTRLASNPAIMGEHASGRTHSTFIWAAIVIIIALTTFLLIAPLWT